MPPILCKSSIIYFPEGLDSKASANLSFGFTSNVLQVCQEGRLVCDSLEILDREFYFGGSGHRKEVQNLVPMNIQLTSEKISGAHGIGGAPDNIDYSNSVEEGLSSDDIPTNVGVD